MTCNLRHPMSLRHPVIPWSCLEIPSERHTPYIPSPYIPYTLHTLHTPYMPYTHPTYPHKNQVRLTNNFLYGTFNVVLYSKWWVIISKFCATLSIIGCVRGMRIIHTRDTILRNNLKILCHIICDWLWEACGCAHERHNSYVYMNHVSRVNESWRSKRDTHLIAFIRGVWIVHTRDTNDMYKWAMSHVWMSHDVVRERHKSHCM